MKSPRPQLPADLLPEQLTAVIDTREQLPLDLGDMQVIRGTLPTGDYSIAGLENYVAIERKSEADLLNCIGQERERFDREVMRLLAYPVRALVVESSWQQIEAGKWRSKITPSQALGSVLGWIAQGLPVVMAHSHERASQLVSRMLLLAARRRWREARALVAGVLNLSKGSNIAERISFQNRRDAS